jgi:endonuclease G
MYAVIVPNEVNVNDSLDRLAVTVDEVERRTSLDFFSELEDEVERDLESRREPLTAPVSSVVVGKRGD